MRTDYYIDSCGAGQLHVCRWIPEDTPRGIVQIIHGIGEMAERYEEFALHLISEGYLVVAADLMGHGSSLGGTRSYFHGGWAACVKDACRVTEETMEAYPGLPYVLLGHATGSFVVRTILARYPSSGITAAILCGTGWYPSAVLQMLLQSAEAVCLKNGKETPAPQLYKLICGSYNRKIRKPRTPYDWLSRDDAVVDSYISNPLCGDVPTCGLLRDVLRGVYCCQQPKNLEKMKKHLPVLMLSGKEDPLGNYGKGVEQTEEAFRKAGMVNVQVKIYPGCRHEILHELNNQAVWDDITGWLEHHM